MAKKRNILFLASQLPYPPDHGHLIRTYNILKYLATIYNVHFLAFIKKGDDIKYLDQIRSICKSANVFLIPEDVSRIRLFLSLFLNVFSHYPFIAQKYYKKCMRNEIKKILRNYKIDLVHFDILHVARYQGLFKNTLKILTEHNVESLRLLSLIQNSKNFVFKTFMYLQYCKLRRFEKISCSNFDIVVTVSTEDLNALKRLNDEAKYVELPNGVDISYFSPDGFEPIPKSIVWVGGMDSVYNREAVDYCCTDIFPLIQREIPDVTFTVVGKSPSKTLVELSKSNRNVKSVGYVEDVRPYMNASEVFVAPIKSGGGTKLKVLNALAMAKPVVTTSVGAEGIDVIDGQHLIIADDPRTFAHETIRLLKNPIEAVKLGKKGRNLIVEKYDWDSIGSKMSQIYEDTLRPNR